MKGLLDSKMDFVFENIFETEKNMFSNKTEFLKEQKSEKS